MQTVPAPLAIELLAVGQRPLMRLEIYDPVSATWINICNLGGKNYLKDISFSSGGARMTPNPIAGQFSAVISNEGNIFHPNHPSSGYQAYFQAGREVSIWLGGNYTPGGTKDWQRIIGYMDQPEFASDTYELTIKGLDYMKMLSDMKFTKEIQGTYPGTGYTPIDNYWGSVYSRETIATAVVLGGQLYNETDCLQDIAIDSNNHSNWTSIINCASHWAMNAIGGPPSKYQLWIMKDINGVTSGYAENNNPIGPAWAVTMGTEYRISFHFRQVQGPTKHGRLKMGVYDNATGDLLAESPNCSNFLVAYTEVIFTFTATITGNVKLRFTVEGAGKADTEFYVDSVDFQAFTLGANTPYQLPIGATGIYYVELDNQDGAGFQPVWPGKQKGEGWYYDIATRWFSFDKDKAINAPPVGINNLHIWYFEAQFAGNVVADILVKAGLYATRLKACDPTGTETPPGMRIPLNTGVSIDRVWFEAGSTYIDAIRKICERSEPVGWRFYFNWEGSPCFISAPVAGAPVFTTFNPQHFTAPRLYQDKNEIRNRIVIDGEKVAELVGWEENMPSELKDEASDAVSIAAYGEHTKNIRNHLFQDQASITAMCATLLSAYKNPKWYFDFETPYNAVPLELGDTVLVQELLDIALSFYVTHTCLIRNIDVSRYDVTYKCEMVGGCMIVPHEGVVAEKWENASGSDKLTYAYVGNCDVNSFVSDGSPLKIVCKCK